MNKCRMHILWFGVSVFPLCLPDQYNLPTYPAQTRCVFILALPLILDHCKFAACIHTTSSLLFPVRREMNLQLIYLYNLYKFTIIIYTLATTNRNAYIISIIHYDISNVASIVKCTKHCLRICNYPGADVDVVQCTRHQVSIPAEPVDGVRSKDFVTGTFVVGAWFVIWMHMSGLFE